jgi:hypothetical protein
MFETLIKAIRGFLSYFSDPMSEFSLTYHSEIIDEGSVTFSVGGGKEIGSNLHTALVLCKRGTLPPLAHRPHLILTQCNSDVI